MAYFARRLFGFSELQPGQAEILHRVLRGEDTLGVLATGSREEPHIPAGSVSSAGSHGGRFAASVLDG